MDLTIMERLTLLSVLPETGNLATLLIVRSLRENLSFSEEELIEYSVQFGDNGRVEWSEEYTETVKAIPMGAAARKAAVDALMALDEKEEVGLQHLPLFDKFEIEG